MAIQSVADTGLGLWKVLGLELERELELEPEPEPVLCV
jgi:hypothetical protein